MRSVLRFCVQTERISVENKGNVPRSASLEEDKVLRGGSRLIYKKTP